MAFGFVIVALSLIVLSSQANAGCFVPDPGLPPHIAAALAAAFADKPPLATTSVQAPPTPKKTCFKLRPQRPLPSPNAILKGTKANTGSFLTHAPELPPHILAALVSQLLPAGRVPPTLGKSAPAPLPQQPVPLPSPIPCPKVPVPAPASAPASAPAPAIPPATAPIPSLSPDLIQALIKALSTLTPPTAPPIVPATPVAPVSVVPAAAPAPVPTPAVVVPTPVPEPPPAAALPSLDPALLQSLFKNLVVSPPEVCPCSCSFS